MEARVTTPATNQFGSVVQSGLDKRQCTVQLTVFADGEPRVKPLLIFKGLGEEKHSFHFAFKDSHS